MASSRSSEISLLGLLNCVVQGFNTEAVIESTAQGVGGVFHDMYWDAAEGNSGWESVFFPWYIYSHYTKPFNSEEEKETFKNELGQDKRYGGEEESALLDMSCKYDVGEEVKEFKITLENLNWRRQCIKTQCQNDLRKFHQEFPTTARESFVTTGRSVFNIETLSNLVLTSQKLQRERPSEGFHIPVQAWKERGGEKYVIEAMDDGELQVWQRPQPGKEYRIGADISEGIDVGRDTDWSVGVVLDATNMDEVATSSLAIDPGLIVVNSFSKYFGMTGWRLGWCVVPDLLIEALERAAQNLYIAPSIVAQYAALAAYSREGFGVSEERRLRFQRRRDLMYEGLLDAGLEVPLKARGACYLYANVSSFGIDAETFCARLIEEYQVAVTPGTDFGSYRAQDHVRFAYTANEQDIRRGVEQVGHAVRRFQNEV